MAIDQYTVTDPTKLYADIETKAQSQPGPGLDAKLDNKADLGEETYRGTGRLSGRKALITGGDSGIGAATAIAFAREGADVAISYLPEEEADAEHIVDLITAAGQKAVAAAGRPDRSGLLPRRWWPRPSRSSADSTSWSTTAASSQYEDRSPI